ncbi:glutamine-hydrolyzing carbamoyl-phosphate synthase small subunit [Lentisphaera marina]|uniref:glutamine-hydrolyzing carbamoyl-phosphate synthase small subunit n=1 Tax=Lentisphaera marina TaxID=1111041 RepID=UPI002366E540|nr:glutamine-hydrolyzing carbamoyl-phosphate synthase small subunit [Lentisphaera marina]MDD7983434.1 glutamine-hydrolyzing carbamoyl-phosphate synthase small subunit [Lentisphaera marina]
MSQSWNWKVQREKQAFLALEDGTIFRAYSIGADKNCLGETVFNTGMTGYQEILSDPSYAGQFICMTYPEMGNYGTTPIDMEARKTFSNGLIIHNNNDDSNWRSDSSLSQFLKDNGIPALAGVDTRALTLKLRTDGAMKSYICYDGSVSEEEAVELAKNWSGLEGQDYAAKVSCDTTFEWDPDDSISSSWGTGAELPEAKHSLVAYDFGIKWNILRGLRRSGFKVTVVPAKTPASEVIAMNPDAVFFSNGPADPKAVTYAVDAAKELIGKYPIMGICLGHQILGLATGADTYKLKFGHHGCNHPVKNLLKGTIEISSQNHNFAIDPDSVNDDLIEVTHINLNDDTVAGIRHKSEKMFAVQYHPEAAPGPHDPYYLFEQFYKMVEESK